MKPLSILLLIIIITVKAFSQSAYYPDGKKITFEFHTLGSLADSLGASEVTLFEHPLGEVCFKKLTNQPIYILFLDKEYPSKIKEMISSYNYSKYLFSYSYYYDLNDMIKKGTLTKEYLLDAFKEPGIKGEDNDGSEFWIYRNYNVKITFNGDKAKKADVVNYKAYIRNGFAIKSYEVTGSDYSMGFDISVLNYSDKTIKYIYITVTFSNPVKDKIATKTVTAVGPIKALEKGSYEFNDIIYTKVGKYMKINSVKIQYMDGSVKIIEGKNLSDIIEQDWNEVGNTPLD